MFPWISFESDPLFDKLDGSVGSGSGVRRTGEYAGFVVFVQMPVVVLFRRGGVRVFRCRRRRAWSHAKHGEVRERDVAARFRRSAARRPYTVPERRRGDSSSQHGARAPVAGRRASRGGSASRVNRSRVPTRTPIRRAGGSGSTVRLGRRADRRAAGTYAAPETYLTAAGIGAVPVDEPFRAEPDEVVLPERRKDRRRERRIIGRRIHLHGRLARDVDRARRHRPRTGSYRGCSAIMFAAATFDVTTVIPSTVPPVAPTSGKHRDRRSRRGSSRA